MTELEIAMLWANSVLAQLADSWVLAQAGMLLAQGLPSIRTAATNMDGATADLSLLGQSLLRMALVIAAMIILSNQGGMGLQKPVRQAFLTLTMCALFLKGYTGLVNDVWGLF